MKIRKIKLHFENLESFCIKAQDIKRLLLRDIVEDIMAAPHEDICMRRKTAKKIVLMLKPEGDRPIDSGFDSWYDRIFLGRDIISLDMCYDDGSEEEIYAEWFDDGSMNAYMNKFQYAVKTEKGIQIRIQSTE